MTADKRYLLVDLLDIMAALRDPQTGCPWDIEQTFETISPYTIEEAYEVDDAIRQGDMAALKSELGDLLLQVVFHAQIAGELGLFDFADIAHAISAKMVKRHPHVFEGASVEDADAQTKAWEDQKAAERAEKALAEGRTPSVLDDLTLGLPALMRAVKLQKRAARVGFDWPDIDPVLEKLGEEIAELQEARDSGEGKDRIEEEFGDLMFVVANIARHLKLDPEEALRKANSKFERRFRGVEKKLEGLGKTPAQSNLQEMDQLWDDIKAEEKAG